MSRSCLPSPFHDQTTCWEWLGAIGARDPRTADANILSILDMAAEEFAPELLARIFEELPRCIDVDRALNNLERFVKTHAGSDIYQGLLTPPICLRSILILFSDSQSVSDLLVKDVDNFLWLKSNSQSLLTRDQLVADLVEQLEAAETSSVARRTLRRFKQLHMARIACGDLVQAYFLPQVAGQISMLAEAICESTLRWARQALTQQWGEPKSKRGMSSRFVILGLGKLGGTELNYSSDIDLLMVYEQEGLTDGRSPRPNRLFFEQLTRDFVRLLGEATGDGQVYRVDLRLRPYGSEGAICSSLDSILRYYDFRGRTWERQALIKAKPVAGDLDLGQSLLDQLNPWIYRKNLNRADIAGVKALKRRIERLAIVRGEELTNVKTGRGGIRDIEFVIQFLQLLNGGVLKDLHTSNTLTAIKSLEVAGCLTNAEATLLTQNYCWLRKLEHRLQLMFDLQTHTLPTSEEELRQDGWQDGICGIKRVREFSIETSGNDGSGSHDPESPVAWRFRHDVRFAARFRRAFGFYRGPGSASGGRSGIGAGAKPTNDHGSAVAIRIQGYFKGVCLSDGAGPRENTLPFTTPLPPFSRVDCPGYFARDCRDAGSGCNLGFAFFGQ